MTPDAEMERLTAAKLTTPNSQARKQPAHMSAGPVPLGVIVQMVGLQQLML